MGGKRDRLQKIQNEVQRSANTKDSGYVILREIANNYRLFCPRAFFLNYEKTTLREKNNQTQPLDRLRT